VCGIELRSGDDTVTVDGEQTHVDCAEPHKEPKKRKLGLWAAMGSGGQMGMGDVQRDTST
jgi:hypothetical protein